MRSGLSRSRPALEDLLIARSPTVRAVAVRALGHLGDPAAAPALLSVAAKPGAVPASFVTQSLVRLGSGVEDVVCGHLRSDSHQVRCVAADALGLLRAVDSVDDLVRALSDVDDEPAIRAARALGRIGDPRAVRPLLAVLSPDRSWALVAVAARALGALGDPVAAPALGRLLTHPRGAVAENAASALLLLRDDGLRELQRAATSEPANRTAVAALSRNTIGPSRP